MYNLLNFKLLKLKARIKQTKKYICRYLKKFD